MSCVTCMVTACDWTAQALGVREAPGASGRAGRAGCLWVCSSHRFHGQPADRNHLPEGKLVQEGPAVTE